MEFLLIVLLDTDCVDKELQCASSKFTQQKVNEGALTSVTLKPRAITIRMRPIALSCEIALRL